MIRFTKPGAAFLAALLTLGTLFAEADGSKKDFPARPNVLLIVADDLGIELGCYGDSQARTPHIDHLAARSARFETAWVTAASCSPSRGSIHTGRFPHQTGLVGLSHHGFSMDRIYPSMASLLKADGYRTGVIGKYHIAPHEICPWDLEVTQDTDHELIAENRDVRGMAELAREFIAAGDEPFFLMMSYMDPHYPLYDQRLGLPEKPLGPDDVSPVPFPGFDSVEMRQRTAGYYNCVSRLDIGVGLLLDVLASTGVDDRTLIIIVGDHGPPFARAKTSCYDRGLRVPFLVRPPGTNPATGDFSQPVSTLDILPTVADYTGIQPPGGLPGQSLRALIEGSAEVDPARPLYASHYAHQSDAVFPMRAVRMENVLLIHNLRPGERRPRPDIDGSPVEPGEDAKPLPGANPSAVAATYLQPPEYELYDLASDPYCHRNLASDPGWHPTLTRIQSLLQDWRKSTGDPLYWTPPVWRN